MESTASVENDAVLLFVGQIFATEYTESTENDTAWQACAWTASTASRPH